MLNGDGVIFRIATSADPVESPASRSRSWGALEFPRRGGLGGAALISLSLGLAIGLVITWLVWPVSFTNADPSDLQQSSKDDYVAMVSAAYQMDGDLDAARLRLTRLRSGDPASVVGNLIARAKATPGNPANWGALTSLSDALNGKAATLTGGRPDPGSAPQAIVVVATPTEAVPTFALVTHEQLNCQDVPGAAAIVVSVIDANGRDLPNVAVQIRGSAGDEVIYTGLKPERGLGYADYEATPGNWSVSILNAQSDTVSDLSIGDPPADCRADGGATPRGWKLVFQQK